LDHRHTDPESIQSQQTKFLPVLQNQHSQLLEVFGPGTRNAQCLWLSKIIRVTSISVISLLHLLGAQTGTLETVAVGCTTFETTLLIIPLKITIIRV